MALLCRVVSLARSSYYYRMTKPQDADLLEAIEAVLGEFPIYGSRRVTGQLRRAPYHLLVNRKQVQWVMREHDLLQPLKRKKVYTTNSRHGYPRYPNLVKDLLVDHPEQTWVSDITYIRLMRDFVYLAVIMDVHTRSVRGWQLSRSLDQQLTLDALKMALEDRLPEIHHSDQGVQYAATAYIDLLKEHQVQISMAAVGASAENPFAERLMRTIKEEEVELSEYLDFGDAYAQIGHFLEHVYQHKRIHSSLGYLTPKEFEIAWQEQRRQTQPH